MTVPRETTDHRATAPASGARRLFAVSIGVTVLFVFLQSLTAGEFISESLPESARHTWTEVHGFIAYPIMVFALVAAVVATRIPRARAVTIGAGALFVLSVAQWLLGHAISTLGWDWVTPIHVVVAFVVYGMAVWLSVRSAGLRRGR
jgi:lipopolysaccharide export LptBFGC system permease protein LptF